MKLRLAAGCAGSLLVFAAAAAAQPAPPPPADYAGDSYAPDDPGQDADDSYAGDEGYDDSGQDNAGDDGQAYSDAGEPLNEAPPEAGPAEQAPYDDDRGVDPSIPADAEDPPYAYPAPGPDEPDYPPQPPSPPEPWGPPEPPRPPEPPMPEMETPGFGAFEMRVERLARSIRQGMRRGEISAREGYEARRELNEISAERRGLDTLDGYSGGAMAQLEDRLRRLQLHVSGLRRQARGEAAHP